MKKMYMVLLLFMSVLIVWCWNKKDVTIKDSWHSIKMKEAKSISNNWVAITSWESFSQGVKWWKTTEGWNIDLNWVNLDK